MSCSCAALKPGQIIEALNDITKTWQICSISSINSTPSSQSSLPNVGTNTTNPTSTPQQCNTTLSLSVINTPSTIPTISCHDFAQKWRFILPSKLAVAKSPSSQILFPTPIPNMTKLYIQAMNEQRTQQKLQTNTNNTHHMDDISSAEHDEERDSDFVIHNDRNDSTSSVQSQSSNNRKRKFAEFAMDSSDKDIDINANTDNKEQKRDIHIGIDTAEADTKDSTQILIDLMSETDDRNQHTQRVSKRRRLSNSKHTFNANSTQNNQPKAIRTKEVPKRKPQKRCIQPPVIVSENEDKDDIEMNDNNNNNTNNVNGNNNNKNDDGDKDNDNDNKKPRKRLELSSLLPKYCSNLMYRVPQHPTAMINKAAISPPKGPTTIKKTEKHGDDDTLFDVLDKFRKDNDNKFPSLERMESLCNVRRFDAKKLALRYFKCRDTDRGYILMETNEYRCTKCNQMYNNDGLGVDSLTKIKTHVVLHTKDAYKCPVCDKPFVNEHHLLYHIRQKKDATNAHKTYYDKHYAHVQNVGTKRRKRKKQKQSKQTITPKRSIPYPSNYNLPSLNYHDYNVIKKDNMNMNGVHNGSMSVMNGPPPLSPVRNDEDIEKKSIVILDQKVERLPPSVATASSVTRNNSNNRNADDVEYVSPPSPYDIAPLPISTTVSGQEVVPFRILDVEKKEKEYPPVPIAPN